MSNAPVVEVKYDFNTEKERSADYQLVAKLNKKIRMLLAITL